jgi:hypothetical protein
MLVNAPCRICYWCLSTYITLNAKKIPSYMTKLGSKESLIMHPRSTPSSTPISNSLVMICNCYVAQASNGQIDRMDDSAELEVSTLTSSTLVWDGSWFLTLHHSLVALCGTGYHMNITPWIMGLPVYGERSCYVLCTLRQTTVNNQSFLHCNLFLVKETIMYLIILC